MSALNRNLDFEKMLDRRVSTHAFREEWPQARGNSSLKAKNDIKSWPAIGGPQKAVRRAALASATVGS